MALFDDRTRLSFIAAALDKGKATAGVQQAVPLVRTCTCGRTLDFYRQGPQVRAWCAPCGRTLKGRPFWAHADFSTAEIAAMPEWVYPEQREALGLAVATPDHVEADCSGIGLAGAGCTDRWLCYAAQKCEKNEWPRARQ